jgi:hypothetical protein
LANSKTISFLKIENNTGKTLIQLGTNLGFTEIVKMIVEKIFACCESSYSEKRKLADFVLPDVNSKNFEAFKDRLLDFIRNESISVKENLKQSQLDIVLKAMIHEFRKDNKIIDKLWVKDRKPARFSFWCFTLLDQKIYEKIQAMLNGQQPLSEKQLLSILLLTKQFILDEPDNDFAVKLNEHFQLDLISEDQIKGRYISWDDNTSLSSALEANPLDTIYVETAAPLSPRE